MPILQLAMPVPLRRTFDYLPPADLDDAAVRQLPVGLRVLAPFGRRQLVGVLVAVCEHSALPVDQLKPALRVLDETPALPPALMELCQWAATYYQHPPGDVFSNALPVLLRGDAKRLTETRWRLSRLGLGMPDGGLRRAPQQAALLALLQQQGSLGAGELRAAGIARSVLNALMDKRLIETLDEIPTPAAAPDRAPPEPALALNDEQQRAFAAVSKQPDFGVFLLDGITGSGKTEVYLQLIAHCLQRGRQALVLVPEIGLTPQTLARFQRRFAAPIAVLHSGLGERERLLAWQHASDGSAPIVIGTRSAIFTPLPQPGLIIVDEEHDSSFKQQEGFRYSARDLAIKRASLENCPVLLGSATPSLETLHNTQQGRYRSLLLRRRATGASAPTIEAIDIRHAPLEEGLSPPLLAAIDSTLKAGNQALVFINRRGFAPVLMCHDCGWLAQCQRCDARYTVHYRQRLLRCHHCDAQQPLPVSCPHCHSRQLDFHGPGTERCELALQQRFPTTPVIRIDRDTTGRKHAMKNLLETVQQGQPCILVGTQMLAKGHHFPDVTLVGIVDADGGLFSADFRGPEKMAQLLLQVAGRAGRDSKPGRVLLQTHHPDHPLVQQLLRGDYPALAQALLAEREQSGMPPCGHLALARAEARTLAQAERFLADLRAAVSVLGVQALGPLPALLSKRADWFRAQLLLQSPSRRALHDAVAQLLAAAEDHPQAGRLRWSVEIDPLESA